MRKQIQIISLIFILVLSYSCGKHEMPPEPDIIYAGVHDNTFNYHQFATPIQLNPVWESNHLVANTDTIIPLLFDTNTVFSFKILLKFINLDSASVIDQMDTSIIQTLSICAYDSLGFQQTTQRYYVGLGKSTDINSVTAFAYQDMIGGATQVFYYNNPNNRPERWYRMWEMPRPMQGTIQNYTGGEWYHIAHHAYIGFKYKNRLGWIKVDISNANNPIFISYAIKK